MVDDHTKHSPVGHLGERSTRGSVSNENNILLDPDILTDYPTQALLLTVLVSGERSQFCYILCVWDGEGVCVVPNYSIFLVCDQRKKCQIHRKSQETKEL